MGEALVAKHIRDMEQTPALPADQHHRFQTHDSFIAEAERQEQTHSLEELTNYVQETRHEILSTVDSAFDEVRSEIKALSEQLNNGIPQETRHEILLTVDSAFDEVRSEIKALSEQLNNGIPHHVSTVKGITGGVMPDGEPAPASGVCSGSLRISIMGAAGLRNADLFGKSDSYCTCEILGKPDSKIMTHVVKNNLNPTWHHEAELPEFVMGDILVFKIYDQDFGKSDDFLGTVTLKSEQFYPHGFDDALPLQESGEGITATLRLKIPPGTVANPIAAKQPPVEAPSQRSAALGQEDPVVAELQEQLGCLTEAVRNEFNGLHESFELISSRMQGAEMTRPDVMQLAATLEQEVAKRIENEALLQHELANVALCIEQLSSHHGPVDREGPGPELPVVHLALTKAEQSLVASSNLQDGVQDMHQEFFKLAEQQTRLERGLAGLEDLRTKVDRMQAELDSPLGEY